MCEELHTLKHYLRKCLRTNTYYMCHVEDYEPNNKLATLARDWLMKREYDRHVVYNVWFAMRELIIKEFTVDPTYYDVMQTALHNRYDYVNIDTDEEYDWNYANNGYANIKKYLVYQLEGFDDYINETCRIAGELRKMYIDRDLHVDFSDIKSHYVNSMLFCKKSIEIYDKNIHKIDSHDEFAKAYHLLHRWCMKGFFKFFDELEITLTTITLVDIIGAIVHDVCKNCTNECAYACTVYMTWYAVKMWTMLESDKKYHTIDEIKHILTENNVNIKQLIREDHYDFPNDENDVFECIQHCEKLLDEYINKFNRGITRVDVSDLPFHLPYIDFSTVSYKVKYYRELGIYKDVLIKYINIISASNGIVRAPIDEFDKFNKGIRVLSEIKESTFEIAENDYDSDDDNDKYSCDYDSTDDGGYAESEFSDSE